MPLLVSRVLLGGHSLPEDAPEVHERRIGNDRVHLDVSGRASSVFCCASMIALSSRKPSTMLW